MPTPPSPEQFAATVGIDLDEFQWRFNRRVDLASMLGRLARAASKAAPRPRRSLKIAAYEAG